VFQRTKTEIEIKGPAWIQTEVLCDKTPRKNNGCQ
jgi:hypothetical protein